MKKIYKIFILLAICIGIPFQWSNGQSPTVNLYRPTIGNQLYEATQKITLSAGFTYDAQGKNTFNASVISGNGQSYNFSEPTSNSPLTINTAYPVGSIAGSWSVNPNGGAIYSIPINNIPGIGSMVPNVSVVYNSQAGEGLLGLGWNISGLSCITRTANDLYHETYISNIQFNSNDHFLLDGQRLIPVTLSSGSSGTQEYRTENESFSRVTFFGPADDPTYFTVETKDGKTIEYGNSIDSRIEAQGRSQALIWSINKISDKNGNYITFSYSEDNTTGEYYPLTINYTGNGSVTPFNTIEFEYQTRTVPVFSFVSGSTVSLNSLLKNIYLKNEGTTVSQFQFLYNTSTSRLTEIVEYGKNNSRLNSSIVNWGTANSGLNETNTLTNTNLTGRYQGDFNGDGKTDMVIISTTGATITWQLFLANSSSGFTLASSGNYDLPIAFIFKGDFNGDGMDDLIFIRDGDRYFATIMEASGTNFTPHGVDYFALDKSLVGSCIVNDFDGDGRADLFVKGTDNYGYLYSLYNSTLSLLAKVPISNMEHDVFSRIKDVSLDMNGNGKAEIMSVTPLGSSFYEFENGSLNKICDIIDDPFVHGGITTYSKILFGDFNGDGKTDIYSITGNECKEWISSGTGFWGSLDYTLGGFLQSVNSFFLNDVDGDGKSDLIAIGRGTNTSNPVNIYIAYSDGQSFNLQTYTPPDSISIQGDDFNHFGDYNGDGTVDYYYDDGTTGRMYTFNRGINQNLVSYIRNGLGLSSGPSYSPLTDNNIYTKGNNSVYPIMDYKGAMHVASGLWTLLESGAFDITNYSYNAAHIHRKGKGFLGFQQVTSFNILHNTQTITQYENNPTYFNVAVKQINVYSGSSLISQVVNTNSLIDYGGKRILPYISQAVGNDYVGGITKTTATSIDNNGNLSSMTETFDDGSYNTTEYLNYSSEGSWMPVQPQTVVVTKKHYSDDQPFSLSSTYSYLPGTGLLSTTVTGPLTTTYLYNGNGTPSQVTLSDGSTNCITRYEYDTKGRYVEKVYNSLNHLMQYTHDAATGNIVSEITPNGQITSYTYDDFGRQTGVTYPTGQSVTLSYQWATDTRPTNALFYILTTSTGLPSTKEYYDGFGKVLRTESTGFDGTSIYTSNVYDAKGKVTQSSLPYYAGQQAMARVYTYDSYGRLTIDAGPTSIVSYTYSGKTTQAITGTGQVSSKTTDSQGNLISTSDEGGAITYTYKSIGKPAQITTNGSSVSMDYDAYGRQTKLTDPNAGVNTYGYNGYGELTSQIDAKGNLSTITYDLLGRIAKRIAVEGTTTYNYDPENNPGLLSTVTYPGGGDYYSYDSYNRLSRKIKAIGDSYYLHSYSYDIQGRKTGETFPSGFSITNVYNTYGYLSEVRRVDNNALIWKGQQVNALGQLTQYQYGNNLTSNISYSNTGILTGIQTGSVQNLNYTFDPGTGNLTWRIDGLRSLYESFTYDNLNRLASVNGSSPLNISYNSAGNIASKTSVGNYTYGTSPNALSQVSNPENIVPTTTQNISYTSFNKVDNISEGSINLQYTYDGNRQRNSASLYKNSVLQNTTHYVGDFEREDARLIHYIAGGDGIAAIYVLNMGLDTMYYIHTDHLGSYDAITNQSGTVVQNYSFDAWGLRRNPSDWTYNNPTTHSLFSRGYTGHEHLDAFNLINMNGRVYDPLLGRFLSPDNYVQAPNFTQSYNRYTYCFNNPLAYTDPSGYFGFGPQNAGQIMGPGTPMYNSFVNAAVASYQIGFTTMSVLGMVAGAPAWLSSISSFAYEHSTTGEWNYLTLAPAAISGLGLAANELGKALVMNNGNLTGISSRWLGGAIQLSSTQGFEHIGSIGNFVGNGINLGNAFKLFKSHGNSEKVYITDNGNYKVAQFNRLESTVKNQMKRGINNSWQQRNYSKVLDRINNTVALDFLHRGTQRRKIHLDQNHFDDNVSYKYRGTVPEGENVYITVNGERILTIDKGNDKWISGSFDDVEDIGINMTGNAESVSDVPESMVQTPDGIQLGELHVNSGFNTRIIGTWNY